MGEYDIYLNGKGYMLAKEPGGQLLSGAARTQYTNPFARFLSTEDQYARVSFRVGDGAGLAEYDGSHRYESAEYMDTRSGRAIAGAKQNLCQAAGDTEQIIDDTDVAYLGAFHVNQAGTYVDGVAEQFTVPAGKTSIRNVAILVRRWPGVDYSTANDFTVAIYTVSSGIPGTLVGSTTASLKKEADAFLPFADRWRSQEYFWLIATFTPALTVSASTNYFFAVENSQWPRVTMAEHQYTTANKTRATWDGATWTSAGSSNYPLMFKIRYKTEIDAWPRCFCEHRGTDNNKWLYAGVGPKVMYLDPSTDLWANSKTFTDPVLQLIVFGGKMFMAQGPNNDVWYTDGASATTTWSTINGQQAQCMAIHDGMLWKADGASVHGSTDGTTWTGAVVTFGDPGSPVMSMVSHGGKLFAAKPEGIFEITYPSDYPTTGTPVANMMLDFRTEISPRTWLLDWHSGLYFPGYGGVYELKSGILRNLWTEKLDEGAMEVSSQDQQFTRPSRLSPLYDNRPGGYVQACGTSRGLYVAYAHPHLETSDMWHYDGRNWHQLGPVGVRPNLTGPTEYRHYLGEYCLAVYLQDLGGGRGRLWYGQGMNIGYWNWATWTNDRSQDPAVDYHFNSQNPNQDNHCFIVLPRFSLPEKHVVMHLRRLGVTAYGLDSDHWVWVWDRRDGATAWTSTGIFDASPYDEFGFYSNETCREIQFRLDIANGSDPYDSKSQVIVQLDLMYQPIIKPYTTHQVIVAVADYLTLQAGGSDSRTAKQILAELEALADGSGLGTGTTFTYIDPAGNSRTVKVTGLSTQHLAQLEQSGGPRPTTAYAILSMLEM